MEAFLNLIMSTFIFLNFKIPNHSEDYESYEKRYNIIYYIQVSINEGSKLLMAFICLISCGYVSSTNLREYIEVWKINYVFIIIVANFCLVNFLVCLFQFTNVIHLTELYSTIDLFLLLSVAIVRITQNLFIDGTEADQIRMIFRPLKIGKTFIEFYVLVSMVYHFITLTYKKHLFVVYVSRCFFYTIVMIFLVVCLTKFAIDYFKYSNNNEAINRISIFYIHNNNNGMGRNSDIYDTDTEEEHSNEVIMLNNVLYSEV
uniref:7TM_GPCR_Srx domain-containing protein n=1 Tax=Parastrongyloides trichosuri TaxID=131310 RepID=A0A0N4ZZG6_PARTI